MPLPESSLLHLSVSRSVASLAAVALASACAVTPSSSERTESTSSSQSSSVAVVDWSDDVVGTAHLGSYVELYGVFGTTDTVSIAGVPLTVTYTSSSQINAQVPSNVPLGPQTIEVTNVTAGSYVAAPVDVLGSAAVTCLFTAPTTIAYDGMWAVSVTSSVNGYGVYWNGTHNGVTDATNEYAGGATPFSSSYGPYTNAGDVYTRWAALEDANGNTVCSTNTITVTVQ